MARAHPDATGLSSVDSQEASWNTAGMSRSIYRYKGFGFTSSRQVINENEINKENENKNGENPKCQSLK